MAGSSCITTQESSFSEVAGDAGVFMILMIQISLLEANNSVCFQPELRIVSLKKVGTVEEVFSGEDCRAWWVFKWRLLTINWAPWFQYHTNLNYISWLELTTKALFLKPRVWLWAPNNRCGSHDDSHEIIKIYSTHLIYFCLVAKIESVWCDEKKDLQKHWILFFFF